MAANMFTYLGLFACCVGAAWAVSCTSTTENTCAATLAVTSTCSSSVCLCETGYTAVATGCARTGETTVEKPTVVAYVSGTSGATASGQVLATGSLALTCKTNYTTGATFAWLEDGSVSSALGTSATATVSVGTATFSKSYACRLTYDSNNIDSDAFAVTGYAAGGTISAVPAISGMPESDTGSAPISLFCNNLPTEALTAHVEVTWTVGGTLISTPSTSQSITLSTTNQGQTVKCTVSIASAGSGSTLTTADSPTLTLPAAVATSELIEESSAAVIPASPVIGGYMKVQCYVRAATLDGVSYGWLYDSQPVAGQEDHTLQINAAADASHGNGKKYACKVKKDTYSPAIAETSTITVATIPASTLSNSGATYATGSSYTLTCTNAADSPGVEYQWKRTVSGGSEETLTETSKTLSLVATTTSTTYTCAARLGSSGTLGTASSSVTVLASDVLSVTATGATKPMAGLSYTYTCVVSKGATVAVTYRWLDADSSDAPIAGAVASTYSFTAGAATATKSLKCEATPTGGSAVVSSAISTTSVATPETPVLSTSIPTISGGPKVQDTGSYTMTCATLSVHTSTAYTWTFTPTGGSATTLGAGMTYTIGSASTSNEGTYKCTATIGGTASADSNTLTVGRHAVKGAVCSSIADCTSDLTVNSGNCINGVCECAPGVPLQATQCGTISSGATAAVASLLLMVVTCLVGRFA